MTTLAAPTPAANLCTFRCLETDHTFDVEVAATALVVLTQTATCWEHVAAAVRVGDWDHR